MARNIRKIAGLLGAEIKGTLPEVGGGAFGLLALRTWSLRSKPGFSRDLQVSVSI